MPDPISKLELAKAELDRVFGPGHAAAHPELVAAVVCSPPEHIVIAGISAPRLDNPSTATTTRRAGVELHVGPVHDDLAAFDPMRRATDGGDEQMFGAE